MSKFIPIVLILASVALFFLVVDPKYKEIQVLKIEESKYDEALNKSKELQELRNKLLTQLNTISSEDLNRLEKLLPDHVDNVRLIIDINNVASRYGMIINNLKIERAGDKKATSQSSVIKPSPNLRDSVVISSENELPYKSLVFGFNVSGSYEVFLQFLKDLERSLRIVNIKSLSFSASDGPFYNFSVAIETYWLK